MTESPLKVHEAEVFDLCVREKVSKLYAFGSVVDGRYIHGKSDIDFLVEFDKNQLTKQEISRSLLLLWISFQKIFKCDVDLISTDGIRGRYFKKYLSMYKVKVFDKDEASALL